MNKKLIFILLILLACIFAFIYGRKFFTPVIQKIKGKETVDSRILTLEESVKLRLKKNLDRLKRSNFPNKIMIVAFKHEQILQVYATDNNEIELIKEYPFTKTSGILGPKLKEGDKQIPEGIYKVEYLNPNSSYHLSIKVSYPNEFDKSKTKLSSFKEMGGDIFIHGKAVTIGCIPIGDKAIEEVFLLTQKAMNNGVKIIISPKDFRHDKTFPKIDFIDWENELYNIISKELEQIPVQSL